MYPEELGGTELGHYMIFYSLANAHDKTGTDFKMANKVTTPDLIFAGMPMTKSFTVL